jgi:hypothetical protein
VSPRLSSVSPLGAPEENQVSRGLEAVLDPVVSFGEQQPLELGAVVQLGASGCGAAGEVGEDQREQRGGEEQHAAQRDLNGLPYLAARLNRSPDAIRIRVRALGVHAPCARRRWSAKEDQTLRDGPMEDQTLRDGYARGLICAEIGGAPSGSRTPGAVSARARKLGLTSYAQTWSAEQDELLRQAITTSAMVDDLATVLTRSPEAVRRRARAPRTEPGRQGA